MSQKYTKAASPHFVTGSLLRHILVMTGTGTLGLMAIFIGELANVIFLSWLSDEAIVAAIGYASSILFFTTSIGIGLSIAATALVAPAVGLGDHKRYLRLTSSALIFSGIISSFLAAFVWLLVPSLLLLLGASLQSKNLAQDYLEILIPFLPPLAVSMTATGILRSVGDAKRAMLVTVLGAFINISLDPVLIFFCNLGIHGAAIASGIARLGMLFYALYSIVKFHNKFVRPSFNSLIEDWFALSSIAFPAILTNIATPVGNAYVTFVTANYGDSAVAAWAIIGRIIPVAFGFIYALSGSIGPIIGQNYGAQERNRLIEAFTLSLAINAVYVLIVWFILLLGSESIVHLFKATEKSATLILFFCQNLSPLFVFLGFLFVANAAFNTLGYAHLSTLLNWGRATIGTVPFVEIGSRLWGAEGILFGNMIGGICFGAGGVWLSYRIMSRLDI